MKTMTNYAVRPPSEVSDTPDLDVTPIMNMFIILIPFLVSMAVFTHLSILEFDLPPNAGTGLDNSCGKPTLKITVVVANDYLAITRGENMLDSLSVKNHTYDFETFKEVLAQHRKNAANRNEAVVAVHDNVRFKHVVHIMDQCRAVGFEKIGLSNATNDAAQGV